MPGPRSASATRSCAAGSWSSSPSEERISIHSHDVAELGQEPLLAGRVEVLAPAVHPAAEERARARVEELARHLARLSVDGAEPRQHPGHRVELGLVGAAAAAADQVLVADLADVRVVEEPGALHVAVLDDV